MVTTTSDQRLNGRLALAITAATLGSAFQHGYNTGVTNAPQSLIKAFIRSVVANRTGEPVENVATGAVTLIYVTAVSIFCVGGIVGSSLTGLVANALGQKGGLLTNNLLIIVAAALQGFSKSAGSYEMIIAGRFFCGVNAGLNAGLAPMYLADISPVRLRGAVCTVYQLVLTVSILVSQVLGLGSVLGTANLWPVLLAFPLVPALCQLALLPFCPESPVLILAKSREVEARRVLTWLRGTANVETELREMQMEHQRRKNASAVTIRDMLTNRSLRTPLIISVATMFAQQFSGINAVMFFSTRIFQTASLTPEDAKLATLLMGSVNVTMTVVSLFVVEKCGRKTLLLACFGGMFFVTSLLTLGLLNARYVWVSHLCIALVILFVSFFAVGPGPIPWFLVCELFDQSARPAAVSVAGAANWIANIFVGLGFLPLQIAVGAYSFIPFNICQLLSFVFVWYCVPETKNRPIADIVAIFEKRM